MYANTHIRFATLATFHVAQSDKCKVAHCEIRSYEELQTTKQDIHTDWTEDMHMAWV
jgi:hypothetical protein